MPTINLLSLLTNNLIHQHPKIKAPCPWTNPHKIKANTIHFIPKSSTCKYQTCVTRRHLQKTISQSRYTGIDTESSWDNPFLAFNYTFWCQRRVDYGVWRKWSFNLRENIGRGRLYLSYCMNQNVALWKRQMKKDWILCRWKFWDERVE